MRKRILYGLVIAACLLLAVPGTAHAAGDGSFAYSYAGSGNLQSAVENELVSNYDQFAGSYDYSVITSLTLSGNLHNDDYTFFKSNLTAVLTLDLSGVTSAFPSEAFLNCASITQVKLPINLALSDSMFRGCTSLTTLAAGSGALTANVIDLSGYTATSYGNSAFQACTSITQVKLPADKALSQNMFYNCTYLTTLGIGSGALTANVIDLSGYTAASYGVYAFRNCASITQVKLPAGKALSAYMFYGCTGLTTLVAGSDELTANVIDLSGYTATSYGNSAFRHCTSITQVKLPADKVLSESMFDKCAGLTTLVAGSGALTANMIDLSDYTAASYGDYAFRDCTGITQVKLPADKALSSNLFKDCTGLTTLVVGSGELTANVIDLSGYTAASYGTFAFSGTGITQVRLPANLVLSNSMFANCENLTTLVAGSGTLTANVIDLSGYTAASYGTQPFINAGITQVKLPAGKALSAYMFGDCTALHSIFFAGETAPVIGSNAFFGTSNAAAYVPDSATGGYEATAFSQHFTSVHTMQTPSFVTHPQPQTKTVGVNVTFSVEANGAPAPALQWQVSTNDGANWSDLSGETADTFSFTAALSQNGHQYRCVASSLLDTDESDAATLTVLAVAATPTASFSFDGANAGELTGTTVQMKYSLDGGTVWTDCAAVSTDLSGVMANITAENDIKVKDVGDGSTTVESEVQTINITRAATPSLTATQPSVIGGDGSIPLTAIHEYSDNGGSTWTSASGTITLPAGTYLVRVKASGTVLASDTQSITLTDYTGVAETAPAAVVDYAAEKLTGLTVNGGYAVNGTDITADADGKIEIVNTLFGTTISLVKKGDGITTNDSAAQSIPLTARPAAPVCDVTQPNASSATGRISGITTAMEYSTDGGASWTDGTDNDVTGLAPGTVAIRVRTTSSAPAGLNQSITITAYVAPPPSDNGGSATTPPPANITAVVKAGGDTGSALPVAVDTQGRTASVNVGSEGLTQRGTTITIPSIPAVDTYTISIPVPSLSTMEAQGSLTLETDNGSVAIPSDMLTGVAGAGDSKAEITIGQGDKSALPDDVKASIGDKPLISLTMSIDGVHIDWSNPNAPVTVSIPYTPTAAELLNPEAIVIWYIDGAGNVQTVPNGRYDAVTGTVVFSTTHFSDYAVAYYPVSFADVADNAWYAPAVSFIAAREITSGTGGGNYSPEAKLTRGEFIVLMMRAYGISPDINPTDNFSDAGNTYYTGYLAAAKRLGISAGVGNNMYAPTARITRQEMFTLLYNALEVIDQMPEGDSGRTVADFSDASDMALWAREAMTFLVKTGTVGGSGGKLTPADTTTRAEMAQVLYNLLRK